MEPLCSDITLRRMGQICALARTLRVAAVAQWDGTEWVPCLDRLTSTQANKFNQPPSQTAVTFIHVKFVEVDLSEPKFIEPILDEFDIPSPTHLPIRESDIWDLSPQCLPSTFLQNLEQYG